jgi:hypothetical protein
MRMTGSVWTAILPALALASFPHAARAQTAECIERCGVILGGPDNPVSASQYDNCMNSCRYQKPALPDGWIVFVISEKELTGGIAHGFTSQQDATTEALTVCRRNRGTECRVAWSHVNTCMAWVDSINSRPWIWSVQSGGSREEAVGNALIDCRRRGGDNCLVRNTPCSDDDHRFPSPFEPASSKAIVDPNTVGTWELPVGKGRWVWQIDPRGTYQFHSETGDGARHFGSFASNAKVWALHSSTGAIDSGPYTVKAPDRFIATGVLGTGNWHRISSKP